MTVQTTTGANACNAQIWLDDASSTARNLSGQTSVMTPSFTQPNGEFFTFGAKWPKNLQCPLKGTIAVQSVYTTASNEAREIIFDWFFNHSGTNRSLAIYTPTKDVGCDKFSGEFKLTDFTFTGTAGEPGPMMVSYTLVPDGAVTWSVAGT